MATGDTPTNSLLLGEIKATVVNTADDVKAIRMDMSDLSRRTSANEVEIQAIKAERATMVPDYGSWRHKISNQTQELIAWRNKQEGALLGGSAVGKLLFALLGMIGGIGGWAALQAVAHPHQKPALSQTVVTQPATSPAT